MLVRGVRVVDLDGDGRRDPQDVYDAAASTPEQPVYVCQEFGGLGLSVRLT